MNEEVGPLLFFANFDSGNLATASLVDTTNCAASAAALSSDLSFGLTSSGSGWAAVGAPSNALPRRGSLQGGPWTSQRFYLTIAADCAGQGSFEAEHNRSWFYFAVRYVGDGDEQQEGDEATAVHSRSQRKGKASELDQSGTRSGENSRNIIRYRAVFHITNLCAANRIFDHDNRPVYSTDEMDDWDRLPQPLTIQYFTKDGEACGPPPPSEHFRPVAGGLHPPSSGAGGVFHQPKENYCSAKTAQKGTQRISWSYQFTRKGETVYFATCYPYSYRRQLQHVEEWNRQFGSDAGKGKLVRPLFTGGAVAEVPTPPSSSQLRSRRASQAASALPHSTPVTPIKQAVAAASPVRSQTGTTHQRSRTPPPPPAPLSFLSQDSSEHPQSVGGTSTPTSTLSATTTKEEDRSGGIYFVRETLCFSVQSRRVDLLTITGYNGMSADDDREPYISQMYPVRTDAPRPHQFPQKHIALITCRVHPGETPASYVLHGFIQFLLSTTDMRAAALREHFVFKIVPMLNPDGVANGHYRTDTRGVNLNRMYDHPDPKFHPTIHATRALFQQLESTGRLALYLDLHAHASRRGCFIFGNAWDDNRTQVEALVYPKILSLNSVHFDFTSSDFTSRSMRSSSRIDGTTKGGTGRVALASSGSLVECYTLEASYCMGLLLNNVVPLAADKLHTQQPLSFALSSGTSGSLSSSTQQQGTAASKQVGSPSVSRSSRLAAAAPSQALRYSPDTYAELGRGIAVSLLDLKSLNPNSRLPHTCYGSVAGVRAALERQLALLHAEQRQYDVEDRSAGAVVLGTRSRIGGIANASFSSSSRRNSTSRVDHVKALERLGASRNLPTLNAYNNASQHRLCRDESGSTTTVKDRNAAAKGDVAPLRLLAN